MPDKYTAAIDVDKALERPIAELSAAELIQALNHPKVQHPALGVIADKKKYELWVEEGVTFKIPLAEIFRKLRTEKKKVELEPAPFLKGLPDVLSRADLYANLVEDVANRVAERLERT